MSLNGREFDADQRLADAGAFRALHVTIFEARSRIAIGREHDCFHRLDPPRSFDVFAVIGQ